MSGTPSNFDGSLLASAARTASILSPTQINLTARGVLIFINVTAVSGTTPTLQPQIYMIDPVSGALGVLGIGTTITGTGAYVFACYPGVASGVGNGAAVSSPLPRQWAVNFVIGGTTPSFTFSVGYSLVV